MFKKIILIALLLLSAYLLISNYHNSDQIFGINSTMPEENWREEKISTGAWQWGKSPFSIGDTISDIDSSGAAPKIKSPNIVWETQSHEINKKSITYVFGQGQPSEIAIPKEKIDYYMTTPDKISGEGPRGYVTASVEYALKKLLENPSLPYFIEKCYQEIDWYGARTAQDFNKFPKDLDISKILFVDKKTGLKELDYKSIETMLGVFNRIDNPLDAQEKKIWPKCLSITEYNSHLVPLHQDASELYRIYSSPQEYMQ